MFGIKNEDAFMPDCGVHYLWFAFVCFLIRSHTPPASPVHGSPEKWGGGSGKEAPTNPPPPPPERKRFFIHRCPPGPVSRPAARRRPRPREIPPCLCACPGAGGGGGGLLPGPAPPSPPPGTRAAGAAGGGGGRGWGAGHTSAPPLSPSVRCRWGCVRPVPWGPAPHRDQSFA